MKRDGGESDIIGKVAIGLGLVLLPALLIAPIWISSTTDREPIWDLALRLALFVVGGCLAAGAVLVLSDRAAARGKAPMRMNRWLALGVVLALIGATVL